MKQRPNQSRKYFIKIIVSIMQRRALDNSLIPNQSILYSFFAFFSLFFIKNNCSLYHASSLKISIAIFLIDSKFKQFWISIWYCFNINSIVIVQILLLVNSISTSIVGLSSLTGSSLVDSSTICSLMSSFVIGSSTTGSLMDSSLVD